MSLRTPYISPPLGVGAIPTKFATENATEMAVSPSLKAGGRLAYVGSPRLSQDRYWYNVSSSLYRPPFYFYEF